MELDKLIRVVDARKKQYKMSMKKHQMEITERLLIIRRRNLWGSFAVQ